MDNKNRIHHSIPDIREADFEYIQGIIDRNYIGDGILCTQLRDKIKSISQCDYVLLTSNGTSALKVALYGLKKMFPYKKKIIVSSYVCPSVISSISLSGLTVCLTDITTDSLSISTESIKSLVDEDVLAIICSNIGGIPDDYDLIECLGVPVVSDCAQSLGTIYRNVNLLKKGICSITSFGPLKVITGGLGGALITDNEDFYNLVKEYSTEELDVQTYLNEGYICTDGQHFSDLNAGLIISQLERLNQMIERRRYIAKRYDLILEQYPAVKVIREVNYILFNRFKYFFFTDNCLEIIRELNFFNIDARSSISHAIYKYFKNNESELKNINSLDSIVSLPIYPSLSNDQVEYICQNLTIALEKN